MKKIIYLFFLVVLILPISVSASDMEFVTYTSEINVNKNRTLDIEENYQIYFVNDTEYIVRRIPKNLKILRKDKSSNKLIAKITDIKGSNIKEEENDNYKIINLKTGSNKESLVDQILDYNLSYSYNLGRDTERKYDEFYYNIVSGLDAAVSNLVFEITFPSEIREENIEFVLDGKFLETDEVTYIVEDNLLTGYLNIMVDENSTFAVRVELPDNYFMGTSDNFNYFTYLYLLLPILSLIVILVYYNKYGKGNKFKSKYTYYPPNNYDPAEISYLYKGKIEEIDLTSLLIHLANKGYIKFEEDDDGYKLGRENTFRIIKVKDYDDNNAAQKILFEGLFKESDICELNMIEYNYFDRLMDSKKSLDNRKNRKKMFNLNINNAKIISILLIVSSIALISFDSFKLFTGNAFLPILFIIVLSFSLFVLFTMYTKIIVKLIFGLVLTGGGIYMGVSPIIGQTHSLIIYIVGMLLIIIMLILYSKLSIRTRYGNKMFSDIYGFKISLETVSSRKLKELLKENPNYFYDMCPYAYVLGILDTWFSKGKNIIVNKPDWHISTYDFDLKKENKFIKNILFTTTKVMLKRASSSNGIHIDFKQEKLQTNLND